MHKKILNLGILAHVDAGKTSLTERMLFDNGATNQLGSVDAGTTKTDSGEIERERGITIRAAVASFVYRDIQVNVIDTPGHPDFIAEVERALSVLDGVVLVISAVEGVQPQTRVLMRSLRALNLPTILFINKIDRIGARTGSLLDDIRKKLVPHIIPMNSVYDVGTAAARVQPLGLNNHQQRTLIAEILAEHDDAIFARFVDGFDLSPDMILSSLINQTRDGRVYPVFFGSALTGEGASELTEGITTFLPLGSNLSLQHELRGSIFAIERAVGKEKIAYVRLFSGELRERQRITLRRLEEGSQLHEFTGRIAQLEIIGEQRASKELVNNQTDYQGRHEKVQLAHTLTAGNIGKIRGLTQIRVGDYLGERSQKRPSNFPRPTLMSVIRARQPEQNVRLHAALMSLADEDPLIQTRVGSKGEISVLLYGAVQQEVIAERLQRDFGVAAIFEAIKPLYFERPSRIVEVTRSV